MFMADGADEDNLWKEFPLFAPEGVEIPKVQAEESAENLPDVLGALSHLLYDEETPEEVAEELREQGNKFFKRGNRDYYKLAIAKYSEALDIKGQEPEVTAAALSNRAAAHLKLKNFGKALQDAEKALELLPEHLKSRYRAASAAAALKRHGKVVYHCNAGLETLRKEGRDKSTDASVLVSERRKAERQLEKAQAIARRRAVIEEKAGAARIKLDAALSARNVSMGLPLFALQRNYNVTQPSFETETCRSLVWPVLIIYPDAKSTGPSEQSDYLERVVEGATLNDLVATVLPPEHPPPEWDTSGVYHFYADRLEPHYRVGWTKLRADADSDDERDFVGSILAEDDMGEWKKVSRSTTLGQLLSRRDYIVPLFPVIYLRLPTRR